MLKKERQDKILAIITAQRYSTVRHLSDSLYVAPITIRRDLVEMERSGLLKRCHGGAAIWDSQNREIPFELRSRENPSAKNSIARKAAKLLSHGDTVFLDASSTVTHLADYMTPDMELTVITNSVRILELLRGREIRCYLTGGMVLENSHALVGRIAEDSVSSLFADICFFSSQGITEDGLITDFSEDETRLRKLMIQNARKSVFLYDHSKIGKRFLFKVCHTDDLYRTVTDDI